MDMSMIRMAGAQILGQIGDAGRAPGALTTAERPAQPQGGLTRRRKAAMVVQMLLAQGQKLSLANMPEEMQLNLTRELARLRIVDRETMHAVAEEFAATLGDIGMATPGGIDGAVAALADQISPSAAAQLKSEESRRRIAMDPWGQIVSLPAEDLKPIVETESIEVSAVILSKLPVPKAAQLLGMIPGDHARQITFAMNQTSGILPDAVARIGRALALAHCMNPVPAFPAGPDKRLGAILDSSGAITRESVLEGLGQHDPAFADQVRRTIFTFKDIPQRVESRDVGIVVRGVDGTTIVTALTVALAAGGADGQAAEFILSNMSQRMSDQLREEIGERGKVRASEGEKAMKEVVDAVKAAAERGDLVFVREDEEED